MPDSLSDLDAEREDAQANENKTDIVFQYAVEGSSSTALNEDAIRIHITSSREPACISSSINGETLDSEACDTDDHGKKEATKLKFGLLTWRERMILFLVCFASFSESALYSCLSPFFPLEAAKKGATGTETAMVIGVFQLIVFLASPFFGKYLTHFGSKFLFVTGILVCGYCSSLFGMLEYCPKGIVYLIMAFLVRIIEAIGGAAYLTAAFAIVANEFPNSVSIVFGTVELFSGLGYLTGPLIGSALFQFGGFKLPFLALGALVIFSGFVSWRFLPSETTVLQPESNSTWKILKIPRVVVAVVSIFCAFAALGFLTATFATHLDELQVPGYAIGLTFTIPSVLYAIFAPLAGFLSDKKGFGFELMAVGSLSITLAFLIAGPSPLFSNSRHFWMDLLGAGLLGAGVAACGIPPFDIGLKCASARGYPDNYNTYGLVSGIMSSAIAFSTFIGAACGGLAVDFLGFPWATTAAAAASLTVAVGIIGYTIINRLRGSCKYFRERRIGEIHAD